MDKINQEYIEPYFAPINSPIFTGIPEAPIPTTTNGIATKGYVDGLDINNVKLTGDQTISGVKTFSDSPIVPTATTSGQAVNKGQLDLKANIASPTFTGTPEAPTAAPGSTGTQIANLDFVNNGFQAAKTYADGLVVGLLNDRGSYDASSNLYPSTGGSGSGGVIKKGNLWSVTTAGVLGGVPVGIGDWIRALTDSPAQTSSNWSVVEGNFGYVPENVANKSDSYTASSTLTYPNTKALVDGLATKQPLTANIVTGGTGFTNYLTKSIGGSAIGNSLIYDNGSAMGVGTTSPIYRFDIFGGDSDGVRYTGTSGVEALLGVSSTNVQIGSASNHPVQFLVNQMTKMTLTSTGLNLLDTPTAPTAAPGSTGTQIANLDFVQGVARPYKVYTALLTQTGTDAPVATILENTLGGTLVWAYDSIGNYTATLAGVFTSNKSVGFVANGVQSSTTALYYLVERNDIDTMILKTFNQITTSDNLLVNSLIEIRVYN